MTGFPDSGWIASIQKIEWWVSASFAATALTILTLRKLDVLLFGQLSPTVAAIVGIAGVLSFFLFILRLVDDARKAFKRRRESRVQMKFGRLSDQQKNQLTKVFNTGERSFKMPASFGTPRWLEELESWNYITHQVSPIFVSGMPSYYSITVDGWKQIEKFQQKLLDT